MGLWEIFFIAAGLSADAFAIALCKGLGMRRRDCRFAAIAGLFFGGSQALMPLLGWFTGVHFSRFIVSFDHFIVFSLLSFIGAKMIFDAFGGEPAAAFGIYSLKELVALSFATSIDAFTVGMSFAFLRAPVMLAALIIGAVTFFVSFSGVILGGVFGASFKRPAQIAGGASLIFIGIKILIEHLSMHL
ncbi:MAG: manganese efflux pump [Clostridia bacterium]|nr:manganese efflux pump [Clostridia bacterium]